jgi:hypothetical protein
MLIWDVVSRCDLFTPPLLAQAGEIPERARGLGSMMILMLVIFVLLVIGLALLLLTRRLTLRHVERDKRHKRQIPDAWTESARRMKVEDEEEEG